MKIAKRDAFISVIGVLRAESCQSFLRLHLGIENVTRHFAAQRRSVILFPWPIASKVERLALASLVL